MSDIPPQWQGRISEICALLLDNYTIWQPFALLFCVGVLIGSITIMVEIWGSQ